MLLSSRSMMPGACPRTRILAGAVLAVLTLAAVAARAQNTIRIDASQPYSEPGPARYDAGSSTSPSGSVIGVNSRYLTLDGKPWLPVMGEFHYARYPRAQWEEEILKMKAAGINIVAAYVFWIHHEEIEGQYDWSGDRDLRAFVQLCAKHGMYVEPRIGPWAHGEVRNGGLPDWLLKKGPTRVNDPVYLSHVRKWYAQIGLQLKGQMWKDGGPVVAIQLENEYSARGAGAGEAHILELKRLAVESGFDVPFYFVTGWDNAAVPLRAVIPIYGGGYPDAPWDGSIGKLPPPEVYAFRFQSRVAANMGAIGAPGAVDTRWTAQQPLPYLTAEIGGGIEDTYHRRPVVQPDDIGAMFPVMLGSGVNLFGSYMFQGGENPDGKLTTLQESQATGYPNDLPVKGYDFQAPLSEFGEERASFRKMKVFQYFLNDFGSDLAPMTVHAPDRLPASTADLSVPRAAVRSRGDAGFIFLNNYVRGASMPARPAAQFEIRLPGGVLRVPREPVDIPSGAYFIWPFNLRMGGVTLRCSTAQLFTRLSNAGATTFYFEAVPGIPAEFAFDAGGIRSLHASSGETTSVSGTTYVSGIRPGVESAIDLVSRDGKSLRLVVLTAREAEDAWRVRVNGGNRLLLTSQDFFADPDARPGRIWLRSRGAAQFAFALTPPATLLHTSLPLTQTSTDAQVVRFTAQAAEIHPTLQVSQLQPAGEAPPVKLGPTPDWRPHGVAQAPDESAFQQAARWSITVPKGAADGLSELFLQIKYEGDIARLQKGSRLLTDDFFNGLAWNIGLRRFLDQKSATHFDLSVLPLRKDAPVYFELSSPPAFSSNGQAGKLVDVRLTPEYQLVLDAGGASNLE